MRRWDGPGRSHPSRGTSGWGGSALSYAGRLGCTVHVDADVLDTDLLARVLQDELEVLSGG